MRVLIGGLMGLCLLVSTPLEAQARGDSRAAAQNRSAAPAVTRGVQPARTVAMPARGGARQSAMPSQARQSFAASGSRFAARQPAFTYREPAYVARGQLGRAMAPQRGRSFAAIPYGRPLAQAPSPYRQTAMASCSIRGGRRMCTTGATRSVAFRWGSDLGAASMSQSSCPDGTIATIAVGHTDVVRCVPL